MRSKLSVFIFFCLFLFTISCDRRLDNPLAKKYEIKGTFFEGYDAPSIPDYPLALVYYEINSRNDWINQKTIEYTRTDHDGYFEFRYSKFSKSKTGKLAIIQDESGLKDGQALNSAPFLKGITLNSNVDRDIASLGISKLIVEFKWFGQLPSDSLFINGGGMLAGFQSDFKENRQTAWGYILDTNQNQILIECNFQWNSDFKENDNALLVWGLGFDEFYKSTWAPTIDSLPNDFNRHRFFKSGFPYSDTVHIELD